jgi:hypothetical protein
MTTRVGMVEKRWRELKVATWNIREAEDIGS